ncbi:helix-turn-helix domain-containing protein [Prosthecomicrobium hirschii]|uniref:helix-turn-helix domain-containing protein n=1 Tax=Prosthecodimorpha hirschii TaxID=665126 RepID=UPI0022210F58|nr:helix-turn-helix domain-containing protein [Prosthecomicrobium hirschii]MCW1844162.1 hypothetical protein [Prosthecomicrobium hirschii]
MTTGSEYLARLRERERAKRVAESKERAFKLALRLRPEIFLAGELKPAPAPQAPDVIEPVKSAIFTAPVEEVEPLEPPAPKVWVRDIVAIVGRRHLTSSSSIVGASRRREVVRARMEAYYLAAALSGLSISQVAKRIGGRDHTTVLHGVDVFAARHGLPKYNQISRSQALDILERGVL